MTNIGTVQDTEGKVWNIQLMDNNDPLPIGLLDRIVEQEKAEQDLREEMTKLALQWFK